MRYHITHSCGHEETVQIYGRVRDRQPRIDWMEGRACRTCWLAEKKATAEAASADLPALTGSPKQIAWALSLRIEALESITKTVAAAVAEQSHTAEEMAEVERRVTKITALTSARYWIDARGWSASHHIQNMSLVPTVDR